MMRNRLLSRFSAAALVALSGAAASGDVVILRDGTEYQGTITQNTSRMIVIRTVMGKIVTEVTLERWRVAEFRVEESTRIDQQLDEKKNDGDDDGGPDLMRKSKSKKAKAKLAGFDDSGYTAEKRDGHALVLEIPMKGTFGQDIYPKSIASGLEWAVEHGVTNIVFRIDSGGGEIWASDAIVDIMNRHKDDLVYHGLIESAISASIWPMFNCDTISMAPGSDFGGAVVYSMSNTGSAEVDKKMNGIRAAKLASAAEGHGHVGATVHAMTISEAELWAYRDKGSDDEWTLTDEADEAKAKGNEYQLIDADDEVLTLTASQAVRYGIVDEMNDRSIESFATSIELGPYDEAGEVGIDAAEHWNELSSELRDELTTAISATLSEYSQSMGSGRYSFLVSSLNAAKKNLAMTKRLLKDAEAMEMDAIIEWIDGSFDLELMDQNLRRRKADLKRLRQGG